MLVSDASLLLSAVCSAITLSFPVVSVSSVEETRQVQSEAAATHLPRECLPPSALAGPLALQLRQCIYFNQSPVDWRLKKLLRISGDCSVPSAFLTVVRKASSAMPPNRGSLMTGQNTQGKPWLPSCARKRISTKPFCAKSSIWLADCRIGVPSRSLPLTAAIGSRIFLPSTVNACGV